MVTKQHILDGLRHLGITPGLSLMVHSSLKSFGRVDGGAETVIEAIQDALTPEGTLMLPSFNHGRPFQKGGAGYYAPHETPTTNGTIPDTFWRMPGVCRSLNPSHPFAAWGQHARRYTASHHRTLTMGPGSPLELLFRDGGSCLLIGVDMRVNTFQHVVEQCTGAPCLGPRTDAHPVRLPDGRTVTGRTWGWRAESCPLTDGKRYHPHLRGSDCCRETTVGSSPWMLFAYADCWDIIARLLRDGADGFPPCRRCRIRPIVGPHTVPSDWDVANNRLKPDSEAWAY
ncbi:MAG: AAC(3) family N-acetyltransferase [Kiritimatiellae bacterium]|nr:AAC(3) family N-acetyltransferase [Kiritimatiellia bacterium]